MSNTTIYNEKALPYVYKGTNLKTGEFYFGYREANKVPAHLDLGIKYKTSAPKIKERFDEFQWEIVAEFATGIEAYDHEQLLIFESWDIDGLLNKSCFHGKERFRGSFLGESNPFHGKKHTPETCKQMSENHADVSGENNPMYGKPRLDMIGELNVSCRPEVKEKIVKSKLGKHFYNNGTITKLFSPGTEPIGWVKGIKRK